MSNDDHTLGPGDEHTLGPGVDSGNPAAGGLRTPGRQRPSGDAVGATRAPGGQPAAPNPATGPPLVAGAPSEPAPAVDMDVLAGLVYERVSDRLDQRSDRWRQMPSVEDAVALREQAPELYDLWLRIAQERAETGNYVQRAPYEVPERLAQSGRPRALSSLVVVLAFCGYLAWLGGPGPYLAGLIAVFDLIVMLGVFFGLRPEHLSETRGAGRKRLTACWPPAPAAW